MKTSNLKKTIAAFKKKKSPINILNIDFHNREQRAASGVSETKIEELKTFQRIYRLFPHDSKSLKKNKLSAEDTCLLLLEHGLSSAHQIAEIPEWKFLKLYTDILNKDETLAREIHHRATQVKAQVKHLVANVRDVVSSKHYRSTLFANVSPELTEYVESIPSYQDLFGGLDYLKCNHCASIFSPSAYFLDIMRITDRYISEPSASIPAGYKLSERRPDLFDLKLTCSNTDSPIPYIQLVNEILEEKLNKDLNANVFDVMALAPYPFNLPFNLPLSAIRIYLDKLGIPLATIAVNMLMQDPSSLNCTSLELARAVLSLSPETIEELVTIETSDEKIGEQFGFEKASVHLPVTGTGTISFNKDSNKVQGSGTSFMTSVAYGSQVEAGKQIRTVIKIISDTELEVDLAWLSDNEPDQKYTLFPVQDLADALEFRKRTKLSFDELQDLFRQNLSKDELHTGIAETFFINDTGQGLASLSLSQDAGGDTDNPITRIKDLSLKRLDRLSRFIRTSQLIAIDFTTLDWLIRATGCNEISNDFVMMLASIKNLSGASGLSLTETTGFLFTLKTRGKEQPASDLFDRIFNSPDLVKSANPYTSKTPEPFDPARPLAWAVGKPVSWVANDGQVSGATETEIILNQTAPTENNVLDGLMIVITAGKGAGQKRIIKEYNGTSKKAIIYDKWDEVPDQASSYSIGMEPNVTNRLASALKVKESNLDLLGVYLQEGLKQKSIPLLLTLEVLTYLWRLAVIPVRLRIPIENYLVMRRILQLKNEPSKNPSEGLEELQTLLAGNTAIKNSELSVYELDYVLNGTTSRFLRIAYNPDKVPAFINTLAQNGKDVSLTVLNLAQTGLDDDEAEYAFKELTKSKFINTAGIVLRNEQSFDAASLRFPLVSTCFVKTGIVIDKESEYVFNEFSVQKPAYLADVVGKAGSKQITINYNSAATLNYLFAGVSNAPVKRSHVSTVMNELLQKIEFTMLAETVPVRDTAFENSLAAISRNQSIEIFKALRLAKPAVIIAAAGSQTGALSVSFSAETSLSYLFTSKATGQTGKITSYEGTKQLALVTPDWTTIPDAFSFYQVTKTVTDGFAKTAGESTIQLADNASVQNEAYTGLEIIIREGRGVGERKTIIAYEGATKTATVNSPWKIAPDSTSWYQVTKLIAQGNAEGGSKTDIILNPQSPLTDGVYDGLNIELIADPAKKQKIDNVLDALFTIKNKIDSVKQLLADKRSAQENLVLQSLSDFLNVSPEKIIAYLAFATGRYDLFYILPDFLTALGDKEPPKEITRLTGGLSRMALLADKLSLATEECVAISRKPAQFGVQEITALSFSNVCLLSNTHKLISGFGTTPGIFIEYLDTPEEVVGNEEKFLSLANASGWSADQARIISDYLKNAIAGWQGINTVPGILRMADIMNLANEAGCDGNYLVLMAEVVRLPKLGEINGTVNKDILDKYKEGLNATLSVLNSRYSDQDFTTIGDQLERAIQTLKRNALLDYSIWFLNKKFPQIKRPSDLFQFLLIDVEMSGTDTTSRIAQGINSVQLYMQHVRMCLEPGASADYIPREIWWEWMSNYRLWEVNRKIFLYPENYINPSLRKNASPEFSTLIENLMQSSPTSDKVSDVFLTYFEGIEKLSNLVHVAGYKTGEEQREGGQRNEFSCLVARTNTTPYTYYVRSFTKSSIQGTEKTMWDNWKEVKVAIKGSSVVPVFSFDRIFLFWSEVNPSKGSKVDGSATEIKSQTHSSWHATLKYTFRTAAGEWVAAQELQNSPPVRIMPNNYASMENEYVAEAFDYKQQYWNRPYAQNISRGLPGTGTLSFTKGFNVAFYENAIIDRQLNILDQVYVAGQLNTVKKIDLAGQQLVFKNDWLVDAYKAPFKIIPGDKEKNTFSPYQGKGTVSVVEGMDIVDGQGTQFKIDFQVGDSIEILGECRTVKSVVDDIQLIVDRDWNKSIATKGAGKIILTKDFDVIEGENTKFETQLQKGKKIIALNQERIVKRITSNTQLVVDIPFDISESSMKTDYFLDNLDGTYMVIPKANGKEKLVVFFGPDLDIKKSPAAAELKPDENKGDDPFISDKNQFNEGLKSALNLASVVKNNMGIDTLGVVSGEKSLVLTEDLQQIDSRVLALNYDQKITLTSAPIRAFIDRPNSRVALIPGDNVLINAYWGNSAPGTSANQLDSGIPGRPMLYNISKDGSLFGFGNQLGWFLFNNTDQSFLFVLSDNETRSMGSGAMIRPYWQPQSSNDLNINFGPYTTSDIKFDDMKFQVIRLGTNVINSLKQRLFIGGIDLLLSLGSQNLQEPPFDNFYQIPQGAPPTTLDPKYIPKATMDFEGSFGAYFWEIFYHAPLLVAEQLRMNRNFSEAKKWYEYIFNPTAKKSGSDDHLADRFWRFRPFRKMDIPSLESILKNNFEINTYNDNPFDPDAIASLRISAYAKAAVMKYINNLIEWGDSLFSQDTRESITQATNLYVLASDLLGPRPEQVGECKPVVPKSYNEIKKQYDNDIPQFLIEAENSVFVSGGGSRFSDVPFNDINSYFCIPENDEFIAYWNTIEDRLFKIRNGMNIQGVERSLALFAPAIDPRAIIQSFGNGGSIANAAYLSVFPIPNFRFTYLSSQARSTINDVIQLGSSLLSALEKKDAEALAKLHTTQEAQILNLTSEIRERQIKIVSYQGDSLNASLDAAKERKKHYSALISDDLLPLEILEVTMTIASGYTSTAAGILQTAASIGYAVPQAGSPFAMTYGGQQLGAAMTAASGAYTALSTIFRTTAEVSGFFANHARRKQEWELQEKLAAFDESQFQAQIDANDLQQKIAEQELVIHQRQIDQNTALSDFYKNKFTNEDLYQWLTGRLAAIYFQAYSVAFDMVMMAQRAFQYELRSNASFVSPASWNNLHKGLSAGEGLMLALNQLEGLYSHELYRIFEISKTISLRNHDPYAFLSFLKTGEAIFDFPESMFDADFPGHYKRRIKTLSVSIPAVVGPYQNIHATLTQTSNRVLLKPDISGVKFLLGDDTEVPAGVIENNTRPFQQITLSTGQDDSGMFEGDRDLNVSLYLPFEQSGTVSSWKLSMPPENNPFAFSGISDVIIELSYTAYNGGSGFSKEVASLAQLTRRNWSTLIQAVDQYAADWFNFMNGPVGEEKTQSLKLRIANLQIPNITAIEAGAIYFRLIVPEGISTTSAKSYISITTGNNEPIPVTLSRDNSFYCLLEPPPESSQPVFNLSVDFDLRDGYTPPSLKTRDGRLSAEILKNIDLILFLDGAV